VVHVCFPQSEEQPLLPTRHLHSLCENAPEEEPGGAVRGGGLLLEPRGRPTQSHVHTTSQVHSTTAPVPLFLCHLPELPLPLQLLMVSAERPASHLGTRASRTGPGGSNWHTGRPFLKAPSKALK